MSSHVFHEIFLHLNWHTKDNSPLITPSSLLKNSGSCPSVLERGR